jgi:uncharacterized protein
MQERYRKTVLSLYRSLRHPRELRQSAAKRWLAQHFVDKAVWRPTRHSFAGGVAVGAFVMMLVIPGQMPVAILLAALLRVNIPIAVIVSWLVNPFTVVPVAWLEIEFGNWLTHLVGIGTPPALGWDELKAMFNDASGFWNFARQLNPWAASLYIGGVVSGLLLAPIGYALSFVFWDLILLVTHRRNKKDAPGA